jgi:hypothetical protein
MEITATIDKHGAATLKATILNSSTVLDIPDADSLADDLEAVLNAGHPDTYRDGHAVLVQSDGLTIKAGNGAFDIPWQHITSVMAQLRA